MYSDEHDVSRSEAIRELLERGVEYDRVRRERDRIQSKHAAGDRATERKNRNSLHTPKKSERSRSVARNDRTPRRGVGRSGGFEGDLKSET